MEILFWFSSFIFFFFFFLNESIFISFRCSFCTWVHLACELLLSFLLGFFLRKSWWFVLTKMEILFWFSSLILSLFFFFMKVYLFHLFYLNVASPNGFILHVDYYYYYFFFFWRKSCWFVLICYM